MQSPMHLYEGSWASRPKGASVDLYEAPPYRDGARIRFCGTPIHLNRARIRPYEALMLP